NPRAIAEMESRHCIERKHALLLLEQIKRRELLERFAHGFAQRAVATEFPLLQNRAQRGTRRLSARRGRELAQVLELERLMRASGQPAIRPFAEMHDGRQRGKRVEPRQITLEILDHALEQKISKRHTAQSVLRGRD